MNEKRVLILLSHSSQVKTILSRCHQAQSAVEEFIILAMESSMPDRAFFSSIPNLICRYWTHYLKDEDVRLAHDQLCLEEIPLWLRISHQFQLDRLPDYHGISLWACLSQEVIMRYVKPILDNIWLFQHVIEQEQPDEVWICKSSRLPYFCPSLQVHHKWLPYAFLHAELMERVAHQKDIQVQKLPLSPREVFLYAFGRWGWRVVLPAYRLFYWLTKPDWSEAEGPRNQVIDSPVAFLVPGRNHADRVLPVADQLEVDQGVLILSDRLLNPAQLLSKHAFLGSRNVISFAGRKDYLRVCNGGFKGRLEKAARSLLRRSGGKHLNVNCLGVNCGDLILKALQASVSSLIDAAVYVFATERVIKHFSPSVFVLTYDQFRYQQAVIRTCHKHQTPTLVVQHGSMTWPARRYAPVFSSRYAVMGQYAAENLKYRGVSSSRIFVTGLAQSHTNNPINLTGDDIFQLFNLEVDADLITILVGDHERSEVVYDYTKKVIDHLNANVLLKVRPADVIARYQQVIGTHPRVHVIRDIDIDVVLKRTDVLITRPSTVVTEAIMADVPVVYLETEDVASRPPYRDYVVRVDSMDRAVTAVSRILKDSSWRNECLLRQRKGLDYWLRTDGSATDRIVNLIEELVELSWSPELDCQPLDDFLELHAVEVE